MIRVKKRADNPEARESPDASDNLRIFAEAPPRRRFHWSSGRRPVQHRRPMKFSLLLFGALALFTTLSRADDVVRIDLDGKPGVAAPAQEDGKDGIARIKDVGTAQLEVFPTAAKESKGTIMIAPGGGYSILAVTHEGRSVAKMLNEDGWDAAVLLYHVSAGPTTRDLAIADAKKGLELLQKRGSEFKLSTKKIGIMGFSAGGHLTARLAHKAEKTNPPQFV